MLASELKPAYFLAMANLKGTRLLKLLLIIAMVMQPVVVSYAMAGMGLGMDHTKHQASSTVEKSHHGDHVMDGAISSVPQQDQDDGTETMNDCCNSAACCPAAAVDLAVIPHASNAFFSTIPHSSWEGVEPPAEIKPPRPHLG